MISVCMTTYNGEKYITEQLSTILDQTRRPDEVVICDDGSTDHTVSMIREFVQKHGLGKNWRLVVNEHRKGYPANFYYAMGLCQGDIVFLADQDDVWNKEKLAHMTKALEDNDKIQVLGCKYSLIDEWGEALNGCMISSKSRETGTTYNIDVHQVFYKCQCPGMVLAYKGAWLKHKMARYSTAEGNIESDDSTKIWHGIPHDFLLCAWAAEESAFYRLDEILAYHRRHGENTSGAERSVAGILNYQRKIKEIEAYNAILQVFEQEELLSTDMGKKVLEAKCRSMHGRYEALLSRSIWRVVRNAWRNTRNTRLSTLLCDLFIVLRR